MASTEDTNFKHSLVGSTAQMSEKKGLNIDLNTAPPQEEEEEEEDLLNLNEERVIKIAVDSDEEEKKRRNIRWLAILDVGKMSLIDYEKENLVKKKEMKRKVEHLGNGSTQMGIRSKMDGGDEFVVPRSTRGRTVAMPNKFKDSVLEPPDFHRFNRTGKSVGVKRKSR